VTDAPPSILERNAAELEDSNAVTMLRVYQALEAVLGLNYAGAENVWRNGKAWVNLQASVAELLEAAGLSPGQISSVVATAAILEANAAAERQKIGDAAPLAERDRVYAGQALGVPEAVFLAPGFDHGTMANPEERARRLAVARANDIGGIYAGKDGAERFHEADREAVELGLSLPRSMERRTEIKRARAIAKNETGALPQIAATTAARTEARTLEAEIRDLDKRVVAEDAERADLKRRKVARAGLAPNSGNLLAARREKTITLDDLNRSRAIHLENIPGYKIALEQPTGWKKLLASELTGAAPAAPLDQDGIVAERHEIDSRVQKYLLDHDMPAENYLHALEAVGADRDLPAPYTRPAPVKLLDSEIVAQRARDYCEEQGWSAGDGELFCKALDAVSS